ncbi:hypothetical protein GHT06_004943 [Daphnia sinensis]|uniref:Uncharacterized protein n=1 Tax=Daphnia sinensis TaxID=1820382 RepID=A0AAD5KUQ5_9CRUS|nr:hypothetical protein GHT06_004943 [Daphnia sinensis]
MWSPNGNLVHSFNSLSMSIDCYFSSFDNTHILENIRNLQADRIFDICGQLVSFKLVRRVQEIQKIFPFFRPYRNLTDKHTNPNTLDRMKVRLAYDVFSDELIATFELFKKYGAEDFTNEVNYLEETLPNYFKKWNNVPIKIDKETMANLLKESTNGNSSKNVRTITALKQLENSTLAILAELTKVSDYPFKGTGTAAVARECLSCIGKLETINETSQQKSDFLKLVYETDIGGLFYPSWRFVSWLVTIEKFLRKVVPLIHGATHIVKDLVEFIWPHLLKCDTMSCGECHSPGIPREWHIRNILEILNNFFLLPISNYANYISAMGKPKMAFKKGKFLLRKYRNFS